MPLPPVEPAAANKLLDDAACCWKGDPRKEAPSEGLGGTAAGRWRLVSDGDSAAAVGRRVVMLAISTALKRVVVIGF